MNQQEVDGGDDDDDSDEDHDRMEQILDDDGDDDDEEKLASRDPDPEILTILDNNNDELVVVQSPLSFSSCCSVSSTFSTITTTYNTDSNRTGRLSLIKPPSPFQDTWYEPYPTFNRMLQLNPRQNSDNAVFVAAEDDGVGDDDGGHIIEYDHLGMIQDSFIPFDQQLSSSSNIEHNKNADLYMAQRLGSHKHQTPVYLNQTPPFISSSTSSNIQRRFNIGGSMSNELTMVVPAPRSAQQDPIQPNSVVLSTNTPNTPMIDDLEQQRVQMLLNSWMQQRDNPMTTSSPLSGVGHQPQPLLNATEYQLYCRLLSQQQQQPPSSSNENLIKSTDHLEMKQFVPIVSMVSSNQNYFQPPPPPSSPMVLTSMTPNTSAANVYYDSSPTYHYNRHQRLPPHHRLHPNQLQRYGSSSSLNYGRHHSQRGVVVGGVNGNGNHNNNNHHHHHHHHHLMANSYRNQPLAATSTATSGGSYPSTSSSIPSDHFCNNSNDPNGKLLVHHHSPVLTPLCPQPNPNSNVANKNIVDQPIHHNHTNIDPRSTSRLSNITLNDTSAIVDYNRPSSSMDGGVGSINRPPQTQGGPTMLNNSNPNRNDPNMIIQPNESAQTTTMMSEQQKQAMVLAMVEEHVKQEAQLRELKGYEASAKYQPPMIDGQAMAAAILTQTGTIIPEQPQHKRSCSQWRMTLFVFYWIIWIVFLIGVVIIVAANTRTE